MRILIIGGSGLISTSITRLLLEREHEVTFYNRGQRKHDFTGRVKEIHGDRKDFAAFEKQMRAAGNFDCVIDMVCFTAEEAQSDVRAFAGRIGQLIFCSTVDVYQRPTWRYPYREGEVLESLSDYGRNKILAERVFEEAHAKHSFEVTILRPAHTYNDHGAIIHSMGWSTVLLHRMRQGKPVIVHGDGNALWVSCHADDVGRAFVNAVANTRAYGRAYHLPGGEWLTWNNYHMLVAEAIGVKCPELVHIPTDLLVRLSRHAAVCGPNFQYTNIFDATAATTDLAFTYTIPVLQGFKRVIGTLDRDGQIGPSDMDGHYDQLVKTWHESSEEMVKRLAV